MLTEILEALFLILTGLMTAYLVRHYVFTLTVLKEAGKKKRITPLESGAFVPSVSILIPAFNEEIVIGRLLQRMCELTYPADKLQILVIDDASTDGTGEISEGFSKLHGQIEEIGRAHV